MAKNAVIETQFFPPAAWFALHFQADEVRLEAHENYQKGGYRNRCSIATSQGERWLSIPLAKGKHQQSNIRNVEVCYDEQWRALHWKTLISAYAKAPFFEFYSTRFADFYDQQFNTLWQWNIASVQLVCDCLDVEFEPLFTERYEKTLPENADWRNRIHPRSSPWKAQALFDAGYYPQVFEDRLGFLPNLSILDLLFCQGPQTIDYLEQHLIHE